MTVERRYSKRYPVDFRVKYRYRDLGPCASQALDLSLQGMLLATESTSPPAGVFVEITFSLAGYSWKIPAVVTRSTPGRMGVMFREAQPVLYRTTTKSRETRHFSATSPGAVH